MRLKPLLHPRRLLPLAGAMAFAGILGYGRNTPTEPAPQGIIWVYYTSLCASPGDASDCKEITGTARRAFDSPEACSAYRDLDLARAANPRLLGSCLRQHQA